MMHEARHDPVAPPFMPDLEVLVRAQRHMLEEEDAAPPPRRYIRQRWEEAYGATRVAVDSLRDIYPLWSSAMPSGAREEIGSALALLESAYCGLDVCATQIVGEIMEGVMKGKLLTHEDLDQEGVSQ